MKNSPSILTKIKSLINLNDFLTVLGFLLLVYALTSKQLSTTLLTASTLFLALSISSAVHYAEVIAKRIGPSLGTLVLALSVTVIEVALIINLMKSNPTSAPTLARDTVFAAIMCPVRAPHAQKWLEFKSTSCV